MEEACPMIIDVFSHILPEKYFAALQKKARPGLDFSREAENHANTRIDTRLRLMDRYPGVVQVLSISQPPLEMAVAAGDAAELARVANDELAELIAKYPDKFIAGIGCLPMNDIDSALKEADRVISELRFRGVQIYSNINGESPGSPKFRPLYEQMVKYDLPIWIHPCPGESGNKPLFGWPYETSSAMLNLVSSGILRDFPDIKFITHHCGAMISFFEQRIWWLYPLEFGTADVKNPAGQFRKFYCDTAVYGSTPALTCAYSFFGADHILFGTDAPLGPHYGLTMQTIDSVRRMDISDGDKDKIFSQNAVNLLRLAI
jgi:predicted TIM-barrel fold metal-dependent hydrolase